MEPPEGSGTMASRLQKRLNELFEKFKNTPYAMVAAMGIASLLFFAVTVYAGTNCLAPLLPPLVLLGLLWYFGIKSAKKLVILGLIACLVFTGLWVYAVAGLYERAEGATASSENGKTLTNGTLEPLKGNAQTTYHFNITVRYTASGPVAEDSVKVIVIPVSLSAKPQHNYTMIRTSATTVNISGVNTTFADYTYSTVIPDPINQYYFLAEVNNTWVLGADYASGVAVRLVGPVSSDIGAVASTLVGFALIQIYGSTFLIYVLLVGMIWWTRRARRMREEQIKKWQAEQAKEEAKAPEKGKAKTPSLKAAMGAEDETFVCSECGADVPADATVCPKCGEKFE